MFKYSYDALVYYGEKVRDSIERCAKFGYDAIELCGEPDYYDTAEVRRLCQDKGIAVSSICSVYNNQERDLAHPDPEMRKKAFEYVKKVVAFAAEIDCHMVIANPTACCKTVPLAPREEEYKWGLEGIIKSAEFAEKYNVNLCLECWNRYETYWLNRLEQAADMVDAVKKDNVGVMGDLFHMNIDESDMAQAIINCGDKLTHIHFADSNRAAPSKGHIDFVPIMKALREINYQGYITFELLPAEADPFGTLKAGGGKEFFDEYTELAIRYIKSLEASL